VPPDIRGPAKLTISLKVTPATQQAIEIFSARIKGLTTSFRPQISTVEMLATQLAGTRDATQRSLDQTEQLLAAAENTLYGMQHSLSWKVTEPLRKMMAILRPKPRTVP
jgi:hypothetical protein